MKRFALVITFAALAAGCISCASGPNDLLSQAQRENPYKALNLPTKSSTYIKEGNSFAIYFIDNVNASTEGDFIISPLSMQFLLGMLLDGAQGQTADEICKVLGYGAGEVNDVNEYCLSMLKQLPELDRQTKLEIANAIVVNQKYPLLDSYKTTVGKFYEAEVENMDFSDNAGTVKKINKWCSNHTNGLIPEVINEVNPTSLAILMNAMYFKSQWVEGLRFARENTKNEPFSREDGSKTNVLMMKNNSDLLCQGNDVFTAVRLPYGNGAFNMVVVLPDEGFTFQEAIESLKGEEWTGFYRNMVRCAVDLWLPKFETKSRINLNKILSDMGMPSAFDLNKANFKAMSNYALNLSKVTQDAVIKVDEEGTEAAVVSKGEPNGIKDMRPGSRIVFHADRPFLYLITENSSGAILFAGKYSGK